MKFEVLTLFPEMFESVLGSSIIGRAITNNIIDVRLTNIRDYSTDKHRRVDDYPYGGGLGMVMQPQSIYDAYIDVTKDIDIKPRVIYFTPSGKLFNQKIAKKFSQQERIVLICGHYEGVDQRLIDEIVTDEISIGDYVLTGGELPAMMLIDCVGRLLPGVLGNDASSEEESFSDGLLEHPQYTRPPEWRGRAVPEVLLSGHHANIVKYNRRMSLIKTLQNRPELVEKVELSKEDERVVEEYCKSNEQ